MDISMFDMQEAGRLTDNWQAVGKSCVKDDGENDSGYRQKRAVPLLRHVINVVEGDHALDECTDEEAHACQVYLPPDGCEPPRIV